MGLISKRYAKALFDYAREQSAESVLYSEMNKLAAVFAAEPRVRMAMENPILTVSEKLELIKATIGGSVSPQFSRFVELVLNNKRETHLQFIALAYLERYRKYNHINKARLVTADKVDARVVDRLKTVLQKIKPGTQEVETVVDPSIDGGFVLYVDTYRLDASVATQLKNIKRQFITENSKMH